MTAITKTAPQRHQENALVTAIRAALDGSADLHILDRTDGSWDTRPWADVVATAEAVAARLESIQRAEIPEPVAVISEPTFETIAVVLAAWMAGRASTILPGPNRFTSLDSWAERTGEVLRHLGVTQVFSQGTAMKALDVRLGSDADIRLTEVSRVAEWPTAPATFETAARPVHEAAVYQGTAGSTGMPKCVELSASAVLHNVRAVLERQNLRRGVDIGCSWLPLYHDMGLTMVLAGMVTGGPLWLVPTSAFAKSPFDWLGWLDHSQATVTAAPNFAYALLGRYARVAPTADLSALRVAINGGEPIDVEATERFTVELAKFGFDPRALCCSYGLAEATCALTMPVASSGMTIDEEAAGGAAVHKAALLGSAMNGVEIRIAPTDHRTDFDDVRDVGEVEFRSAAQMTGYVGEQPIDPGAWIKTGDLGYLVGDQLVVCGRSKELITIAGRNVFPQEVERAAAAVPGVRVGSVAAVGGRGSQTRRDQLVIVAEYVGDDPQTARRAIIDRVAAQCGTTPSTVDFVEAGTLPKTTSGKLRRVDIAARYQ
jgi:long-chain-fatty-acid--[acyl-carrier-protein] ligase